MIARSLSGARKAILLIAACTSAGSTGLVAARARDSATAASSESLARHRALVQQYCVTCHNARMKTGGLVLEGVDLDNVPAAAELWEKVVRKLEAGAMPPAGLPRPDEAASAALVSWLETSLDRAAAASPNPGAPWLHRLNRTEYANAVRDLLDLQIDATTLLPPDDVSGGFDNNAGLLGVSPALLERYLSAAAKISALAVGDTALLGASSETFLARGDASQTAHVDGLPLGTRGGILARHTFPLDGEYDIRVRLLQTNLGAIRGLLEPNELEFSIDGARVFQATVGGDADNAKSAANAANMITALDARLTTRVVVKAGPRAVGAAFVLRDAAQGGSRLQPFLRSTIDTGDHTGLPHVASLTITGPFNPTGSGETPSRRRIFVCRPTGPSDESLCAHRIITALTNRGYRRKATDAELGRLLALYREGRQQGSFETGIEFALRGILTNPKFVFRAEQEPAELAPLAVYTISDLELASRLSFFLWSSIPDEELIDLASRRKLSAPAVLEKQVRRMLADPRAQALVRNFSGQWLQLRNLASAAPDRNEFPDFDDNLRQSFERETELFVDSIAREDRSVLDLLSADYSFVDERLAKHYRIPGVYGSRFRRVTLTDPARRGLLGQGSILTVTSHADRTSPVVRGKWILENLLGTPPPPPPPNVPPLEEREGETLATMRERMEAHRRSPACAGCHKIMDPLGLALENFDAVGAWRSDDAGEPIDASGSLTDGTVVNGPVSLREALLRHPDVFVGNFTEKLLTYALGRKVEYYDMPAVRTIVRSARDRNYKWSSIALGIVNSPPFRMRMKPSRDGERP
jgi:mono/diheme cytochrome c family protein